jgi:myosin heavy subunit
VLGQTHTATYVQVRCIKPNHTLQAEKFDGNFINSQLKCVMRSKQLL